MGKPVVTILKNEKETLRETAELFVRIVVDAARNQERVSVALSGGKTPSGLFRLLSDKNESYFTRMPWSKVHFFWGDERFVPATDEASNFLMAKKTLLDRVPVDSSRVHRVLTEGITPEESAQAYQREIQQFFGQTELSRPPKFDLMLMGLGPDGHTASLFPDAPLSELEEGPFSDCWVKSFFIAHLKDEQPLRISFTPRLINASKNIIFLVTGKQKAQAFDRVLHSDESPLTVPAKLIHPQEGNLYWMIDQEVSSSEIKLVISDVDGTLLTSEKELTSAAKQAILDLRKAKMDFTLTSGRPPKGMLKILKELDLKAPVAAFNGGMYFDPSKLPDIHVILEKVLPEDVCRQIVGRLEREGHDVWIYRKQDWFVRDVNAAHVAKETRTVEFSPTVVPNFEGLFDQVVKIVGVSDQTEKLDEIGKTLGREFKGKASASLSQPYYLDITHPQANKGEVVRFFSQFFGVQGTQVATLGDMPNDVSMFKASGLSIAMGNSDDFVKSSALEVTDSYDDDGFAHAIEKVLKKQAS